MEIDSESSTPFLIEEKAPLYQNSEAHEGQPTSPSWRFHCYWASFHLILVTSYTLAFLAALLHHPASTTALHRRFILSKPVAHYTHALQQYPASQ